MSDQQTLDVTITLPEELVLRLGSMAIDTGLTPERIIRDALTKELAGWPWTDPPKLEAYKP